ncbi:MAG: baseplate J/gp47 family protein [Moraxella sp.]|nr:baseplate J/gp47 family protein [Moraxella sp.]
MIARPTLEKPHFIDRDANVITDEIIDLYESLGNKKLYPAQADRLFIDVIAYREMLIRAQIQLACEQNLLAFADGVMLDYLGDFFGVIRLDDETDEQLRERIRLAPESYATTGSRQAYIYHTLSTDSQIIDADALRDENGDIYIYVLTADGVVSNELVQRVLDKTSGEKVRPLSDRVFVSGGVASDFRLVVEISPLSQAVPSRVMAECQNKAEIYVSSLRQKLGRDIVPSQIIDALSGDGIWQVKVIEPAKPLILQAFEWANCTEIVLTMGVIENG